MQKLSLIKSYKRYSEYKDSGVECLGQVPKEWFIESIKKRTIFLNGYSFSSKDYSDEGLPIIRITDVGQEINFQGLKRIPLNLKGKITKFLVKKNDLLIALTGATIGKTSIYSSENEVYLNQRVGVVRPLFNLDLHFLKFLIMSDVFKENVNLICNGGAQENIGTNQIGNFYFSFPVLEIQSRISNYLNEKVDFIDQIIEKKKKLIELLKEKRTEVINQAVTKGLDPKAEFVDSGIDWIGKIPKGWIAEKLKFVAPERNKKITSGKKNSKYIGLENVESNTGNYISTEIEIQSEGVLNEFNSGDVLFGKLRPYLAKVYTPDFDGVSTGEFLDLVPIRKKISQKYLFYKLISKDFIKVVNDSTYGTKMPRASWNFIGNQYICRAPIKDQNIIINYLDKYTRKTDEIVNTTYKSIKLLGEFKSSLISNVVTGKVKV